MSGYSEKDEGCPQLLDLMIPQEKDWFLRRSQDSIHGFSEEKKLELRLGPPGGDWTISKEEQKSQYSCYFTNNPSTQSPGLKSPWNQAPFLPLQATTSHTQSQLPALKESAHPCVTKAAVDLLSTEKKAFSSSNKAFSNSSSGQKRTAPPVVGWPPVRSFRKNLASGSSSKLAPESPGAAPTKEPSPKHVENFPTTPLVKVNMYGVPIGRKVDLKAHDSYGKLALAVDELFRCLLAAQRDSCGIQNKEDRVKGMLDGSGEYTLVYEDNEGDRLLVGDVPWQMFVSTVKRLRVLKSSELPFLSRNNGDSDSMHQLDKPRIIGT